MEPKPETIKSKPDSAQAPLDQPEPSLSAAELPAFDLSALLSSMAVLGKAEGEDDSQVEADDAQFEQLLQQMQMLKSQASKLPDAQRRDYAEAVAMKMWEAMGGDDGDDSSNEG